MACHLNVLHGQSGLNCTIRDNNHDESRRSELAEEDIIACVANVNCTQLRWWTRAIELKLFDNVWHLLEAMHEWMLLACYVINFKESCRLKQNYFISIASFAKAFEVAFNDVDVRDQWVHDRRPCLIESCIPDRCSKVCDLETERSREVTQLILLLFEDTLSLIFRNQIHLMDQAEHCSTWAERLQCLKATLEIPQIFLLTQLERENEIEADTHMTQVWLVLTNGVFAGLNVEKVDENLNVAEDSVLLVVDCSTKHWKNEATHWGKLNEESNSSRPCKCPGHHNPKDSDSSCPAT